MDKMNQEMEDTMDRVSLGDEILTVERELPPSLWTIQHPRDGNWIDLGAYLKELADELKTIPAMDATSQFKQQMKNDGRHGYIEHNFNPVGDCRCGYNSMDFGLPLECTAPQPTPVCASSASTSSRTRAASP